MSKKNETSPISTSVDPPETARDPITGRYIDSKRKSTQDWFKKAKNVSNTISFTAKSIDVKQVIYAPKMKNRSK